ncbi:MAG: hypothetical protein ACFKPT_03380 [Gloeotrichia echinulata GP01]
MIKDWGLGIGDWGLGIGELKFTLIPLITHNDHPVPNPYYLN